jgi:hypothetical protein
METPERYRHTQVGWVIIVSLLSGAILCFVLGSLPGAPTPLHILMFSVSALLVVLTWLFGSLTVVIVDGTLKLRFGPGLIRKTCSLSDFVSASVVRNKWWYGWGIRLCPRGLLYNASGLDAVELAKKNGRVLRIGTDEPQALEQALREAMRALPGERKVS